MIYYIDIDGVLTNEILGYDYENRTPNLDNIEKLNCLFLNGHKIILWSSRYKRDYFKTKKWLKKYLVKYHKLKLGKPKYDFFIDDKAYNNFGEIL